MNVIIKDGKMYSINNRRLAAYKMANVQNVPIKIHSMDEIYKGNITWGQKFNKAFSSYDYDGTITMIRGTGSRTQKRWIMDMFGNISKQ